MVASSDTVGVAVVPPICASAAIDCQPEFRRQQSLEWARIAELRLNAQLQRSGGIDIAGCLYTSRRGLRLERLDANGAARKMHGAARGNAALDQRSDLARQHRQVGQSEIEDHLCGRSRRRAGRRRGAGIGFPSARASPLACQ